VLAIEIDNIDLGSTACGISKWSKEGVQRLGIICRIAKLRWFEPSYHNGEHGNIRYAPRGLREQPDRLLVFTGRRFEPYYLNGEHGM